MLIDEYDVPLSNAFENGYYDDMVMFVRKMFSKALKSNANLKFAVLTGCLRISKESVFSGLNNFKVNSITDIGYDEMFGFTDEEMSKLLKDYGLEGYYNVIREWYDGYHLGDIDVYCPWDVVNYCQDLTRKSDMHLQKYWMNSSSNDIVNQ